MAQQTIQPNDQVTVRKKLFRGGNLIKTGTVVSISGASATVKFADTPVRQTVPLANLEPIGKRFSGRAKVHHNPTFRRMQ